MDEEAEEDSDVNDRNTKGCGLQSSLLLSGEKLLQASGVDSLPGRGALIYCPIGKGFQAASDRELVGRRKSALRGKKQNKAINFRCHWQQCNRKHGGGRAEKFGFGTLVVFLKVDFPGRGR